MTMFSSLWCSDTLADLRSSEDFACMNNTDTLGLATDHIRK